DSAIVSGYIGRFPPYTKISDEFYVDEPTTNRQSYQLEPIMISRSEETSEIQTSLFYDNLVDDIRFNGGIVDNHDRLFRSEYYSWCPPIDIDMLMNWSSYYWMADGPSVICVESETNIGELIGTSDQITIAVTYSFNNITESGHLKLSNGQKIRLENDTNSTFNDKTFIVTGIGSYFNLIDDTIRRQIPWDNTTNYDSCSTSSDPLIIYLDGITIDDAISDIDGNQEYRFEQGWWKNITDGNLIPSDVNSGGCVMTISDDYPCGATEIASYAPIILTNGGRYVLMEKTSDGWKSKSILIDGVGESINVITDEYGWDSDEWDRGPIGTVGTTSYGNPDYIVMERGAVDANPWSVGNRWFHRDVLHEQDFSTAIQAKRPILCFDVNLSLYNFGQNSLGYIDIKEDSLTFSQINQFDATDPEIYLDALGYPIIWYVGDGSTINFNLPETFEETSVEVFVDGNKLSSGDFTVDAINQIVVLNVAPADGVSVGVFGGIRGYDHLRDYGIAPLLLDADETTKRWIDKNDPSWSLVLGGPVNVWNSIVTAIDEEQLIKSAIFIDDMIQIKGIHYSIQGNSILFNYNIPAGSEIKVIYWDSSKGILAQDGMIVMITDDTLESVENRVFMINGIKATGKISLAPLDPLLNSPEIGDSWFVRYGIENGNSHVYFDGENWIYGQQKTSLNQEPLFNLYDIDGVSINDTGRYPRSTFRGSRIFGFADPVGNVVDEIYGRPIRYDSQNHVVWKNHINTLLADNVYHYSRDLLPISGFYFHRKNINGEFVYSNDWYVSDVQTRQRIRQIYIPFGGETKITIPFNFTIREKKEDVRFAITTNVALNGTTLLIDSVTPEDGDRLILVGQTDKKENGIYEYNQNIGSYTLFRPADADGDSDGPVNEGMFVNVSEGLYRKTAWVLITKNPIIGQTELKFDQIDGPYPFEQSIEVDKNNFILQLGIDYEVIDGDVVFLNPLVKNDIVRISTFDNSSRDNDVGSYVVPLNLQANPNWEQVDLIAQTEFYDHFSSIMTNQIDFSGSVVGLNNYRDTHKNRSYGTSILQHRSPLLKTMLLSSQSDFDLLDSMRYVEREYDRFKKKFRNKLVDLYVNVYDKVVNVDTFVNDAIDAINLGKTTDFPFAYSDVMVSGNLIRQYQFDIIAGQDEYVIPDFSENDLNRSLIYRNGELLLRNYHYVIENGELVFIESLSGQIDVHLYNRYGSYVPPTPAVLGITGLYKPEIITDTTLMTPRQFIIGHDGSYNELFNDEYADLNEIILEFEKRCYNLALSKLSDRDSRLVIENTPLVAGKFRRSSDYDNIDSSKRSSYRSSYDLDEFNKIARSSFERWAIASRIEWRKNTTYDPQNRFTWNYHGTVDKDGDSLPGHWRGIMRYYYDTDRPHICPWEMLGLSQKPNWWDNRYGSYPYTRGNTLLWTDLENGFVAEGENSGHYAEYARPGLSNVIPVDEYGNLLDPVAIGIIVQTPSVSMLSANWKFGDCGPGETMWRRSSYYPYALASATYLMNPSSFVERTWDVGRSLKIFKDTISEQWVYDDSRQRVPHDRLQIHGEIINNQIYHANGCQQFISDFIKSKNQSIERFGNFIRGINVQLGHKMAGYINSSTLQMRADNIGFLPQEDVDVYLYRSPSIAEYTYSGVIIEWTGRSWKVVGYDPLNPFFRIIQSDPNGHRSTVTVGNANLADTAPRWRSQVQYTVGVVVMYVSPTITESPSWQAGTLYKQDQRVTYEGITYRAISTHTSGGIFDISKWSSINIESTGLYRCTRAHLSKSFSDDIGNWEPISDTSKNDGISVIYYRDGKKNSPIIEIPYGTEFFKQQDLFDFLISYQRYLTSVGWKFDLFDSGNNETVDFLSVGKDFLLWSLARWTPGTFLALSPLSQKASFETEHGEIQNIEQITNGIYSILDREGLPISLNSTLITRYGGSVDIKPKSSDLIYFVKLFVSEVEHALTVSNRTIFGDIIYRPLFNLRQPRLKLYATKSNNWNGRVDAPGYVITDNIVTPLFDGTLVDNFEKSINDFRRYYSIEDVVENPTILEHARHLIGYQPRSYLIDLLLTPTSQFQFYQGMIKKKGTISAFSSLLRSYYITDAEDVLIQDEWAFRVGRYGNDEQDYFEFFINDGDVKGQPVLVDFSAIVRNNDVINDLSNDTTLNIPFPYRWKENTFYERGEVVSYEDQYYAAKNDTLTATEFDDQNWIIVSRDDRWRYKPLKSNGKIFPSVRIEYDAETWVPNTTYNVGSYVIYNEKVWQLIGNGNSSIFDDTQWKLIKTNIGYPKTGYARSDEIDFYAWNLDDLENIRIERLEDDLSFSDGQTVMLYADKYDDWSTHKMTLPSMIPNNSTVVSDTSIRTYPIPGGRPKLIDTVIVTHNNAQIDSFEVIDDNIVIDDNFVLVVGDIIDISVSTIIQSYADDDNDTIIELSRPQNLTEGQFVIIQDHSLDFLNRTYRIKEVKGTVSDPVKYVVDFSYNTVESETPVVYPINYFYGPQEDTVIRIIIDVIEPFDGNYDGPSMVIGDETDPDKFTSSVNLNVSGQTIIIPNGNDGLYDSSDLMQITFTPAKSQLDEFSITHVGNGSRFVFSLPSGYSWASAQPGFTLLVTIDGQTQTENIDYTIDVINEMIHFNSIPLDESEIIIVVNPQQIAPTSGRVVITTEVVRQCAFSVDLNFTDPTDDLQTNGVGGELLLLYQTRFNNRNQRDAIVPSNGWSVGDIVFVDSGTEKTKIFDNGSAIDVERAKYGWWSVYAYDTEMHSVLEPDGTTSVSNWKLIRSETPKIDNEKLNFVNIYDTENGQIEHSFTVHDPSGGVIPGIVERDLWYIIDSDPAKYTNGDDLIDMDSAWGPEEIGRLWWDISAVRFYDYEIDDNSYRRFRWGNVAPRTSIDVYEWVRSPVPPASWNRYVESNGQSTQSQSYFPSGSVKDEENPRWVERIEYDVIEDINKTFYYFWVKNPESIPSVPFRNVSASSISAILTNPANQGLTWAAAISEDSMLLHLSEYGISGENLACQFKITDDNEMPLHNQWLLVKENDTAISPDDNLWRKMKDSLVGFDGLSNTIPDSTLSAIEMIGNFTRPRQTWFLPTLIDGEIIASRMAREIFVKKLNEIASNRPLAEETNWSEYLYSTDEDTLSITTEDATVNVIVIDLAKQDETLEDYELDSVICATTENIDLLGGTFGGTIDGLPLEDGYRVLVKNQTIPYENGIYVYDDISNTFSRASDANVGSTQFGYASNVKVELGHINRGTIWVQIAKPGNVGLSPIEFRRYLDIHLYHYDVDNFDQRDSLLTDVDITMEPGQAVLVRGNVDTNGFWSIWHYTGISTSPWTENPQLIQKYKTEDFWQIIDW
ncbi:MAG: carbohydrate-binding protein, partial [Candidimonas sp.]